MPPPLFEKRGLEDVIKKGMRTGDTVSTPSFDSELIIKSMSGTVNADLIITLKIYFEPISNVSGTTDADGKFFELLQWGEQDPDTGAVETITEWTERATIRTSAYWNEKLWIRTPDNFDGLDWPTPGAGATARPNVHCGLKVVNAGSKEAAHAVVRLARLRPIKDGREFRSKMLLWDSDDLQEFSMNSYQYMTAAHEVGHLLGLEHIGGKGPCAYTKGDGTGSPNIMGKGNQIWPENATPWTTAMAAHTRGKTSADDWKASNLRFAPRPMSGGRPG